MIYHLYNIYLIKKLKKMKNSNFYPITKSLKSLGLLVLITCISYTMNAQVQYTNVLKNPGINDTLSDWTLAYDQGTGYLQLPTEGYDGTGAIQAGYRTQIEQVIDLVAHGYTTAKLDEAPIVRYGDWIKGAGPDVNDLYEYEVTLLDANDVEITSYNSYTNGGWITTNGANWSMNTHSFVNYGPGLRKIKILRNGVDAEFDQTQTVGVIMDAACLVVGNHFLYASPRTGDLAGWNVTQNGGDGWKTIPTFPGWQTSFNTCTKEQSVKLLDVGYTAAELDTEPKISIWEFFVGIDGTGSGTGYDDTHNMKVELRDGSGNVLASYDSGTITGTDQWQQVGTVFENYGTGLREVYVEHGGFDSEYWAGHYGGVVDATQMTMEFQISTDVTELEEPTTSFVVYPNPVASNTPIALSFDTEMTGTFQIQMMDALGRQVYNSTFEKTSNSYQTSFTPNNLPAGIYQLVIRKGDFLSTKRISIH